MSNITANTKTATRVTTVPHSQFAKNDSITTNKKLRIVALVSGGGSNLQAIIDFIDSNAYAPIHIVATIADRPAKALARAETHNIPSYLFSKKANGSFQQHIYDIDELLQNLQPDIVVLAGFLGILPRWFTALWHKKIINIHPSLLPKFGGKGMYGIKVHQAVLKAKEQTTGCTIHWVTEEVDGGAIIAQKTVPVLPDDTPASLQARVLAAEHQLYVATLLTLSTQHTSTKE